MTLLVILFGALILIFALMRDDRGRRAVIERIAVGASIAEVERAIGGAAVRCPVGSLGYLETSFPEGWPPSTTFAALEWLRDETSERLVFPLDGGTVGCEEDADRTEIGVDSAGVVVWTVARVGRTPLRLPPWLTPEAVAEREEVSDSNPQ